MDPLAHPQLHPARGRCIEVARLPRQSRTYRFWVPRDPDMEGAHYLRPGPGFRDQVSHGLFGALAVEPAGSTYRDMITGGPIESGWQADVMPAGNRAFREYVQKHIGAGGS